MDIIKGGEADMLVRKPPRTGLERELKAQGITYKALAEEMGVQIATVGYWARGETKPGAEMRQKVSKILGVDIYTLFFHHEDEPDFLMPTRYG